MLFHIIISYFLPSICKDKIWSSDKNYLHEIRITMKGLFAFDSERVKGSIAKIACLNVRRLGTPSRAFPAVISLSNVVADFTENSFFFRR